MEISDVVKPVIKAIESLHRMMLDPTIGILGPWQIRRTGKATADAIREIENAKIEIIEKKLALRKIAIE